MQILIVEDEQRMARLLQQGLTEAGHTVVVAEDGAGALAASTCGEFDAIVLDVMLPGIDGTEVARRLRLGRLQTPILFLTARDTVPDVVRGLDAGGDDYLTKPFAFEVLLARLRALSRRGGAALPPCLAVSDLTLDPATRAVRRGDVTLNLTKTEFALLETLMRRAGRVVPRDTLLDVVWGHDRDVGGNTLEAFVSVLRQKIDAQSRPRLIHTIRGVGYCLRPERPEDVIL